MSLEKLPALMGFKPMALSQNILQLIKYQTRKPFKNSGFDGIQTRDKIFFSF